MKQHNQKTHFLVHFQPFVLKNSAQAYIKNPETTIKKNTENSFFDPENCQKLPSQRVKICTRNLVFRREFPLRFPKARGNFYEKFPRAEGRILEEIHDQMPNL